MSLFKNNAWYVFISSFLIRLNYSFLSDNYFYGGDIFSRLRIAYNNSFWQIFTSQVDWQPGHMMLLKLIAVVFNDYVFAPRLLGIFCDAGSIAYIFLIAKYLFDQRVAFATALITGTYFLSIQFSVLTLSGPVYTFFVLVSTYHLMTIKEDLSYKNFIIPFWAIFMAEWIRSEAWIFAFIIGLCLIYKKFKYKVVLSYAIITIIPIVIFLYVGYEVTGDIFRFINYSDYELNGAIKFNTAFNYTNYIKRALRMFPLPTLITGTLGFILFFNRKRKVVWIIPSLVVSIAVFYKLFNLTLANDPRYFILSSMWFVLMSFGLVKMCFNEEKQIKIYTLFGAVILISNIWQVKEFRRDEIPEHPSQFSGAQRKLFAFLYEYNNESRTYFLDNGKNFLQNALPYMTGIDSQQIKCVSPEAYWIGKKLDQKQFDQCLAKDKKINSIITFPFVDRMYGDLGKMIRGKEVKKRIKELGFKLIYDHNGYKIWAKD